MSVTVLVIDDNALNVELLECLLSAHGFEVRMAGDIPSALSSCSICDSDPWMG